MTIEAISLVEASKQALEALETGNNHGVAVDKLRRAINAATQPEPVIDKSAAIRIATVLGWTPPREPLTDEQIEPMFKARQKLEVTGEKDAWYFYAWGVNDGEAAHGIKERTHDK